MSRLDSLIIYYYGIDNCKPYNSHFVIEVIGDIGILISRNMFIFLHVNNTFIKQAFKILKHKLF